MKRLIKATLLMLAVATSAFAQDEHVSMPQRTPEERATNQTKRMKERLGLTPEQKGRVYEINLFYARQNDKTKNMQPGPEKREEKQAIGRDKETDMKAVLTGEQYQKYQQMVAEQRDKMRERRTMRQGN
jgi:periplasmic protein CpxP/Spy